jgi:pantoate--beta-alanine ligase
MAQIVEKLLQAVQPDALYMGLKDFQQALIVGEMIKVRKLKTKLIKCPTKRETDGLAMSSRNVRLDKKARAVAVELSKTLFYLKRKVNALRKSGGVLAVKALEEAGEKRLAKFAEIGLEYLKVRDAHTLAPKQKVGKSPLVALIAANVGGVRLIDNIVL